MYQARCALEGMGQKAPDTLVLSKTCFVKFCQIHFHLLWVSKGIVAAAQSCPSSKWEQLLFPDF